MKKLMKRLAVVLLVLTGAYTAVAWFLLRGLGVYRLGTTVGTILAYSWQYTGLAALILLVWAVISLLRMRKAKDRKLQTAAPQQTEEAVLPEQPVPPAGKKERRRKEKKLSSGGKISPAQPDNSDKIQPNAPIAPAAPSGTQTIQMTDPEPDGTETLPMPETVGEDTATMPLPVQQAPAYSQDMQSAATEYLPAEEDTATIPMMQPPAVRQAEPETKPSPLTCPGCHAPVKPGAKFCGKCGRKLGG